MEERLKKEGNFVDNIAYKSKFQFLIWVNDNVICQRYFKINGFNENFVHTEEFDECMNGIVRSIQEDLESKSRIFMWYTNVYEPMKMQGFVTDDEIDKYGIDFLRIMCDSKIKGNIIAPDGRIFQKRYINYDSASNYDFGEVERPKDGEFIFKFSFLIDDVPVFEKIWDGNVYPKFVRNGVDLTNAYASYNKNDTSTLSFGAAIVRHMQQGKTNLISDFIRRICDTLSIGYNNDKYVYTREMETYKNDNTIDREVYDAAVAVHGVVKPTVVGHTDIKEEEKKYDYLSALASYTQSWENSVHKKTQEYFNTLYPSKRQIEYIEKYY